MQNLKTRISEPFARIDHKYFNCGGAQIVSYLRYKGFPIELLFYNCLEEPQNLYHEMIMKNTSRWSYDFHNLLEDDMSCIGLQKNVRTINPKEPPESIREILAGHEAVFVSNDLFYIPHRDEYRSRNAAHWVMITEVHPESGTYTILDEKYHYFSLFEYEEAVINEAFANGNKTIIYFNSIPPRYDRLKSKYQLFFENYDVQADAFFGTIMPLLDDDIRHGHFQNSDKWFHALHFFSGSIHITKQFLSYIHSPQAQLDHLDQITKTAENLASMMKKFELTRKMNFEVLEDKLTKLNESFRLFATYIKSSEFFHHLEHLDFGQLISAHESSEIVTKEINDAVHTEMANRKFHYVDLLPYFNNQAFGDPESNADLTGAGEFFLLENEGAFPESSLSTDHLSFVLPVPLGYKNDNISCQDQQIDVEEAVYDEISILGCAEWGDQVTELVLGFEDGDTEPISVTITDWVWDPRYGETPVISNRIQRKVPNAFVPDIGHLFGAKYRIQNKKKLNKIVLPYCPCLHIFAVTLGS
ncbi:BtrH N-terminal domain-containing protein [Paenibacillus sp. P26]|nr:BtrH N-terminal domain-containing protein [Paenibacillus sp. P26]